jgi:hypothetical protein
MSTSQRTTWVWNPMTRRLEPEGKVWSARLHKWIDDPDAPTPAAKPVPSGGSSAGEEPAGGPRRGPRHCPQRSRRKRIGHGPKATLPRRNGVPVKKPQRVKWSFPKGASGRS